MNAGISSSHVSQKANPASVPSLSKPVSRFGFHFGKLTRSGFLVGCCLAVLTAIGMLGLSPQWISLWDIWSSDPLRSIGMLIAPISLVLLLREWKRCGWELHGTWWGLLPLGLAYFSIVSSQNLVLSWGTGPMTVNLVPHVLPIYLYASGVVLLFAGFRIWRRAWFPLVLLLLLQPVPAFVVTTLDLPLQSLSAHIARSFAGLIGFPPTNPDLLRLMFTPDFGMFIAPGCDGMRGAVTLGYVALIVGYLKRVSLLRWLVYVAGAVLLGHLFNLIRLCTLVLYYRIAVGHPALEHVAKQADYVIGGCLFLVATLLFFWIVMRKPTHAPEITQLPAPESGTNSLRRNIQWKLAAFAGLTLFAAVPGVRALQLNRSSLTATRRVTELTPEELDGRLPQQLGSFQLIRAWQEHSSATDAPVLEIAAYSASPGNEVTLGIWLLPSSHSLHNSWMTHGESPELRASKDFMTARNRAVSFDTAFYTDGITDTLAGNTYCAPSRCQSSVDSKSGMHVGLDKAADFTTRGVRLVPIFFRVERPHADQPLAATYQELTARCQSFLSGVDLTEFSQSFQ